jgi:hypothetical protein
MKIIDFPHKTWVRLSFYIIYLIVIAFGALRCHFLKADEPEETGCFWPPDMVPHIEIYEEKRPPPIFDGVADKWTDYCSKCGKKKTEQGHCPDKDCQRHGPKKDYV